ncbi:hypothetical protein [Planktothrix agardhii]|uniref:hypothetical protein n=1 Tax=Planktothrix agardhii TaxID=1160 RepID=UPI001D0A9F4A|nr:hypothetical protein [Planktothrix agardhii]MCB8762117.1 hypothetical protein [Planktothrix agardhii 1813]
MNLKRLEIKDLTILSFLLGLAIAGCSFLFGYINLDPNHGDTNTIERYKIFFPLISSILLLIFPWFINKYVQGNIDQEIKKYDKKIQKYDQEIQNLKLEYDQEIQNLKLEYDQEIQNFQQKMDDLYKIQQELEFLSLSNILDEIPEHLNFRGLSEELRKLFVEDRNQLRARVKEWREESEARREAIEGLEKGFKEHQKNKADFYNLVASACNHALNFKTGEKAPDSVRQFYYDIFYYLRAWLFCSIKHGVSVPIEPFFQRDLGDELKERYKGIDTYISAIEYIKEFILEEPVMKNYFPTPNSKNIVYKYLQELIVMLNRSKLNSSKTLPITVPKAI